MEQRRPLIVDVKRGCLDDGPGIRTVVFFKGCPLRCVFCHNPEAQQAGPELAFAARRCLRCGACAGVCRPAAIDLDSPGRIDRARCDLCGRCAEACQAGALRVIGRYWPADSLVRLLLRDAVFYRRSGGGVTFSGGECTLFPDYLETVLRRLAEEEIHVALETSGCFDYQMVAAKILPYVRLVLFDVKLAGSAASREYLGRPNERMIENLGRLLGESGIEVQPRVPLIPGITDSQDNLDAIMTLLRRLGAATLTPLAYNPLGAEMYKQLGRTAP